MKSLISRESTRRPSRQIRLTGVAVVVLSLGSACLAGCGDSPSEATGDVSPTVQEDRGEGPNAETAPSRTSAPTPTVPGSPTASSSTTPSPLDQLPASPEATATPVPTVAPTPTEVVDPTPTAVPAPTPTSAPAQTDYVLERSEIPSEIEARILERSYDAINTLPGDGTSESGPYVSKITCEKPNSIAYVRNLVEQASLGGEDLQEIEAIEEIGQFSWRVPWNGGFLQFGYPTAIDPCMVEILSGTGGGTVWWFPSLFGEPYLLARTSHDGNDWTTPERFSLPFETPALRQFGGNVELPLLEVTSDGENLLLATDDEDKVLVWVTDDLVEWNSSEVLFHRPESLHPMLRHSFYLDDVILGPNGWLLRAVATAVPSARSMAPEDIRAEAVYISFDAWADCLDGMTLEWFTADTTYESRVSRCVTWDELGIDEDTFWRYASFLGNKPYLQSPNFSGWVLPQEWDATVSSRNSRDWIELPYIGEKLCCDIIGTSAGYLALTEPYLAGYNPLWSGTQRMFFSPDGYEWKPIETPDITHTQWHTDHDGTPFVFIWSIHNLGDSVLVSGNWFADYYSSPVEPAMWIIDPDGTNWREIDPAEHPDLSRYVRRYEG